MTEAVPRPLFGNIIETWPLPDSLSIFEAYGLWNCLFAYHKDGWLIDIIPSHDGDFFPETPFDHINAMRIAARQGKNWPGIVWPLRVDIDVTQECTDRCYFCYSRLYSGRSLYQGAHVAVSLFESLVRQLAAGGTKTVRFTGGGEPLAHPRIKELLRLPKKYGMRSCVITNGDLLDDDIIELLVRNVEHVRISINAGMDETRQKLHRSKIPHATLSYIQDQIAKIASLRESVWNGTRRPATWTTFLILPQNLKEIYTAARAMRDCGADSISFRPVYHGHYRHFSPNEQQDFYHEMERARSLHHPPDFHVFLPKRNLEQAGHLRPIDNFPNCISSGTRTVVEATNAGQALKVCGLHRGTGGEIIGVVTEDRSFASIWESSSAAEVLSNRPQKCSNCIDVSMNVTLNRIWNILQSNPEAIFRRGWQREINHIEAWNS